MNLQSGYTKEQTFAYKSDSYGKVEHNFIAAMATGAIEAQTNVKSDVTFLENGSIVFIDRINKEITYTPQAGGAYLVHCTERYYDAANRGKKGFVFDVDNNKELPRVIKLAAGDVFHTNMVYLEAAKKSTESANDAKAVLDNLDAGKTVYGVYDSTIGAYIQPSTALNAADVLATSNPVFAIEKSTMPDDMLGYKITVIKE